MSLLTSITRWFKRVFGVTRGKKVEPAQWRKATAGEKVKLGKADVKGPVYVQAKKVTKKSKSISKRQYDRLKNNGLSKEQITKSRKPVVRHHGKSVGYTYEMSIDPQEFTRQMIRIVKQFEYDDEVAGYLTVTAEGLPHPFSSNLYLVNIESVKQLKAHLKAGTNCAWWEILRRPEIAKYLTDLSLIRRMTFRVWTDR